MNTGDASEARQVDNTEHVIKTLIDDAEKMGLTFDIRDLLDGFNDYKQQLEVKARELSILEAIAMESKDENIRELREQLFMTVKLIHSDEITEVENAYNKRETVASGLTFTTNVRGGRIGGNMSVEEDDDDTISKYAVMERMRRYLNRRAEYKQFMKQR